MSVFFNEYIWRHMEQEPFGEMPLWLCAVSALAVLCLFLLLVRFGVKHCTARIYNWDGKRYRYLGRAGLHRGRSGYRIAISERMADLSYTTLYRICPSRHFVRSNRYRDMVLRAGREQLAVTVDDCMKCSIYYR